MCSLDLEPCEVWVETPRIARKRHECDGCGVEILCGTAYLVNFHVFDGCPGGEKSCFECWLAREQFAEAHGQSFYPSMLLDQLRQCIGENDDEEDEWRSVLASVLARHRTSSGRRLRLRRLVAAK